MVNVLIFGATGFIGLPTALALRRHSHNVFALTRSETLFPSLLKHELTPLLGDPSDPSTWLAHVSHYRIDIILDIARVGPNPEALAALIEIRFPHLYESAKLGYVLYSGTWLTGKPALDFSLPPASDQAAVLTTAALEASEELQGTGIRPAPALAEGRVLTEKLLLSKAVRERLDVVILRPSLLLGGSGSLIWGWLKPVVEAKEKGEKEVVVVGQAVGSEGECGFVHKEDLADLGVRVVEKFSIAAGAACPVYNVCAFHEEPERIIKAVARAVKYDGKVVSRVPENAFEDALFSNAKLTVGADRARVLFDWVPRHTEFAINMEVYLGAMRAFEA